MMEYIFFDAGLRDQFVQHAQGLAVVCEARDDNMGMVVAVPDELADDQVNSLEDYYEELQDEQSRITSQAEGGFRSMAGFILVLPDGKMSTVPLQPDIANRLLSAFTIEEIQALFSTVARSALDPREMHLCQILRAEANKNQA
jgi:hypothetical protein